MNKEDFFNELRECLQGEVSDSEYRDSVSYYRGYFQEQEALGKTDEEILSELGSARYIAHSIIDAHGIGDNTVHSNGYSDTDRGYGDEYRDTGNGYNDSYRDSGEEIANDPASGRMKHTLSQIGRTIAVIAVLLVLGLLLRFLLPVILVMIVIIMIMNMFRRMS